MPSKKTYRRILAIGDTHKPFHHKKAVAAVIKAVQQVKPDAVIQVGDLYDLYTLSKYRPDPNFITTEEELARARCSGEAFWSCVRTAAPKADCFQIRGNHDARIEKRVKEAIPAVAFLTTKPIRDLFTFPGVTTIHDPEEEVFLSSVSAGPICFQHGHRSKLGDHANYNLMNTVCGHSHRGGLVTNRNRAGVFWELNVGFLADERTKPLTYGAQRWIRKGTLGYGVIDELGPRFVPLSFPSES